MSCTHWTNKTYTLAKCIYMHMTCVIKCGIAAEGEHCTEDCVSMHTYKDSPAPQDTRAHLGKWQEGDEFEQALAMSKQQHEAEKKEDDMYQQQLAQALAESTAMGDQATPRRMDHLM